MAVNRLESVTMCKHSKLISGIVFTLLVSVVMPTTLKSADKEYGQYLSAECNTCHGTSKKAGTGIPTIKGKPFQYLVKALKDYKKKSRENAVMQMVADRLDNEQIDALAAYFSSLEN